ncbi:MAG: TRAP transporter small permease [Deltaproteobacteria bacterium]|nr:MAG: TRAP transporter small permease [Deltaproteobacteria bacterium]
MRFETIVKSMEQIRILLDKISLTVAASLLVVLAVIVNLGVFCRYVLFAPLPWSEQIPKYAMIWMGFLGASTGISRDRHIGFDVLITRLPIRTKKIVELAGRFLIMFFLFFMTIWGVSFAFAVGFDSSAPMLRIPMFYLFLAVPVGGVFMILHLAMKIILDIFSLINLAQPLAKHKYSEKKIT